MQLRVRMKLSRNSGRRKENSLFSLSPSPSREKEPASGYAESEFESTTGMARIINSSLSIGRFFSTSHARCITIPPRIERGPTDILKALAATVGKDPTAPHYRFVDDPALEPLNPSSQRNYALAKEQGRRAARYFLVNYPHLFYRDDAEPKIPAFNPPDKVIPNIDCVEEDIIVSIQGNQVANAIQCYKNCVEKKVPVSPETQLMLLELCCFSNSKDLEYEWIEERWYLDSGQDLMANGGNQWEEDSFAEYLFKEIGENEATLNAMICGCAKHGAHLKAYSLYERAKHLELPLSLSTYNSLFLTVPGLAQYGSGRWERFEDIFSQMKKSQVKPDLMTFANMLEVLSSQTNWRESRSTALKIFNEMDALKIVPSLACYYFLVNIFIESKVSPPEPEILYTIVEQLKKQVNKLKNDPSSDGKLPLVHPKDCKFFPTAMKRNNIFLKDLHLAMEIHELFVANPHMVDSSQSEFSYYSAFLSLLTKTASMDQFMKAYDELVPHTFLPDMRLYMEIIDLVFLYDQLHLVPRLWTDLVYYFGIFTYELPSNLMKHLSTKPVPEHLLEQITATVEDIRTRVETVQEKSVSVKEKLRNLLLKFHLANDQLEQAQKLLTESAEGDSILENELVERFCLLALKKGETDKVAFGLKFARLSGGESAIKAVNELLDTIPKDDANYETIKQLVK